MNLVHSPITIPLKTRGAGRRVVQVIHLVCFFEIGSVLLLDAQKYPFVNMQLCCCVNGDVRVSVHSLYLKKGRKKVPCAQGSNDY